MHQHHNNGQRGHSNNFGSLNDEEEFDLQREDERNQENNHNNVDEDDEDDEDEEDDEDDDDGNREEESWIDCHLGESGNEFLCAIDEDYIRDDFNLTGLNKKVPGYDYALATILDESLPKMSAEREEAVETYAEVLYGLIHARFILTTKGMEIMKEKYNDGCFGQCPRVYCQQQNVLPVGLSDSLDQFSVNIFCPKCREVYTPRSRKFDTLDGCYIGTTFPHLFLMIFSDLIPKPTTINYIPKVYGFKIHSESDYNKNRIENEKEKKKGQTKSNQTFQNKMEMEMNNTNSNNFQIGVVTTQSQSSNKRR